MRCGCVAQLTPPTGSRIERTWEEVISAVFWFFRVFNIEIGRTRVNMFFSVLWRELLKIVIEAWTTLYFRGSGPGAAYSQLRTHWHEAPSHQLCVLVLKLTLSAQEMTQNAVMFYLTVIGGYVTEKAMLWSKCPAGVKWWMPHADIRLIHTIVEKGFQTPIKFYLISNISEIWICWKNALFLFQKAWLHLINTKKLKFFVF